MRVRWRDRLRYWFDGTMDRGTPALIGWLGLASVLLIVVMTALFMAVGTREEIDGHGGWGGAAWMNLMRAIDPGTMGGDTGRPVFLALMLTITIGGVFIVSSLIGVLTTGLENRIAQLRKGRSRLIEHGHTIVLGWSEQVFTVIEELVKANQGQRRSRVVILADRDKMDMDDEIRGRLGDTGRTRVICRTGSPLKRADLELVSPDTAKAIMVLPPPGPDADIHVIKTLLLLNNRTWRGVRPHVVTAVQNSENVAAARLAGGDAALVLDADDIAVRLVVQSHRQAGLSTVCTDLLDFAGNEFYIRPEPALVGTTYGEALHAYERGVPAGLRGSDGRVVVNPPMDTVIGERDHLIVLAEDDLLIRLGDSPAPVDASAIVTAPDQRPLPDRTLLIGWNARATKIIDLLDRLVEPGSVVDIASARRPQDVLATARANLTVGYKHCEPTRRASLETLDLGGYKHIIVLADDGVEVEQADDRTLVTLLHLRDIEVRLGDPYAIVTEINNDDNREVFQVTKADDFIVSTKLISLLLTQLAENRHLQGVFAHLFDPSGSEIYLKPASDYVTPGTGANFATVIEAARRRGHTAIGYRNKRDGDQAPSYGVVLNPPRTEPLSLGADDNVIVLAEE
ncbi:CASTOR/POLLUX-related putative ion channel [Sphaerisporangium krabiense]|uniref:Voltage-gated potassium channel Kch n=1 Tax=Sphaerisporangium krabiense TaxID=763782 RepID=A0A7W8Z5V5_9ACTN|nr:potassium transporter TrkA [Sphaerisporangium krabiense]MBB5628051.1 voltage-gated potassium channel Kch [Sphaerisporangium krabiense]